MARIKGHGRDTSWLTVSPLAPLPLFDGDDFEDPWDRDRHQRLHASLFDVTSGPPLRVLLSHGLHTVEFGKGLFGL